jgi:hypothetical protein
MVGNDWRTLLAIVLAAPLCGLLSQSAMAQEAQSSSASADQYNDTREVVRELAGSVRELKTQVETLNAQIVRMREEQTQSSREIGELRAQLQHAAAQQVAAHPVGSNPAAANSPAAGVSYSSSSTGNVGASADSGPAAVQATPENLTTEQRLERLDENVQFIDAKVNDQYQTKVESGSKYRVRLSGIVLVSLFSNRGSVDNIDFPFLATQQAILGSNSSIGGSLRQSQISLEGFGPEIAGAHTSANLKFDFAGSAQESPNGAVMGGVRFRTGSFRLDWANTSIIAGQDVLFFAPIAPTSLAALAEPALSYAGDLWGWTPQLCVEHRIAFSEKSHLLLQGGILDPLSGDVPFQSYERTPSWGEQSGQPAIAGRVAWDESAFGEKWTLGAGAYHSRQNWGFGRTIDAWVSTVDLTLPITKLFEFSGEFYRGNAVGGLGGGIGQSVLFSGSLIDPGTAVHGLDSMGGWTQLKYKPRTNFQVNAALGLDNPFANELRQFPLVTSYFDETYARNRSWLVNFIYEPRSNLMLSMEYRRLKTSELDEEAYGANHINLSVGYIF